MKMKHMSLFAMITGWVIFALLVDAYSPRRVSAQSDSSPSIVRMDRIGVMPFFKGRCGSHIGETLDCPFGKLSFDPQNLSPGSDRILTGYVQEALRKRHEERVIPLVKVMEVYQGIARDEAEDTPRITAQKLGQALDAKFITLGTVWRYRERVGRAAGAQSPASVAFAVYLIDVASGKMLWKANFAETQGYLSDNVLDAWAFVKKGAKWLSADELARYGVKEIFKKYPL